MKKLGAIVAVFSVFLIPYPLGSSVVVEVEMSFDQQLQVSDGLIHGYFKGQTYKNHESLGIVTTGSFELIHSAGFSQAKVYNKKSFPVVWAGGILGKRSSIVHNAPVFKENDEVVLLLRKHDLGYTIQNLNSGVYKVHHDREKKISLFPSIISERKQEKTLQALSWEQCEKSVQKKWAESFSVVDPDRYIAKGTLAMAEAASSTSAYPSAQRREPASFSGQLTTGQLGAMNRFQQEELYAEGPLYWLTFVFACLGSLSVVLLRKNWSDED